MLCLNKVKGANLSKIILLSLSAIFCQPWCVRMKHQDVLDVNRITVTWLIKLASFVNDEHWLNYKRMSVNLTDHPHLHWSHMTAPPNTTKVRESSWLWILEPAFRPRQALTTCTQWTTGTPIPKYRLPTSNLSQLFVQEQCVLPYKTSMANHWSLSALRLSRVLLPQRLGNTREKTIPAIQEILSTQRLTGLTGPGRATAQVQQPGLRFME